MLAFNVSPTTPCAWSVEYNIPGKFIISPRPTTSSHFIVSATSSGPTAAPVSSNPGTAGTHDGVVTIFLSGVPLPSSII